MHLSQSSVDVKYFFINQTLLELVGEKLSNICHHLLKSCVTAFWFLAETPPPTPPPQCQNGKPDYAERHIRSCLFFPSFFFFFFFHMLHEFSFIRVLCLPSPASGMLKSHLALPLPRHCFISSQAGTAAIQRVLSPCLVRGFPSLVGL